MTDQYEMGITVMDYLQSLGLNMTTILGAICDGQLEKSYKLIQENPNITKEEFLKKMGIEEIED